MARQGRRLRDPGPRRHVRRQDGRLLHQCGRPAALRDHDAARRRRLSDAFRLAERGVDLFRHREMRETDATVEHRALARIAPGCSHPGRAGGRARHARRCRPMAQLAERAARLAGALRDARAEARRSRRHRREELPRLSRDRCTASGTRGLAAVPANAKLHGARARLHPRAFRRARLLRVAGSRRRDRAACAGEPRAADRHRQRANTRRCSPPMPMPRRAARRRRSRLAVLHLGHHRPAEGRDADASRCSRRRATPISPRSIAIAPGDAILHAAPMSHGSGLYIMPHVARLGVNVMPESGGFEPDEIFALFDALAAHVDVRRADHDQAAGRVRRRTATRRTSAPSSGAARRCMSRMRCARSTASARASRRSTGRAKAR